MKRFHIIAAFAATFALAGACTTTPEEKAAHCTAAQNAAYWADIALQAACTRPSKTCDTAGLVLKTANDLVRVYCEVP